MIRYVLVILGFLFFLQTCAPLPVRPPAPPLGPQEIAQLISTFQLQENVARTFFSSGILVIDRLLSKSESNILVVGTREPFRIKMEVTHPWGRPLFHVLVQEAEVQILSFQEKRLYYGDLDAPSVRKFLPEAVGKHQVWSILRGFPSLPQYAKAVSLKENQMTFLNDKNQEVESVDFLPQSPFPQTLSFPGQDIRVLFSMYESDQDILFAKKINLNGLGGGTSIAIQTTQMVFNRTIPEAIFSMEHPPDYDILPLK